jgi:hypothetical protein
MAVAPTKLTIRAYGVGFGDCFLLTFHYPGRTGNRHVLIDFGTTQKPPRGGRNLVMDVARDIAAVTAGHLDVLVATHRHTDHISGFATKNGKGPGDVIAALEPSMVVQPWTERPDAPRNWQGKGPVDGALPSALTLMDSVARFALGETRHLRKDLRDEVRFIATDALKNELAVRNLAAMGKAGKAMYVSYGTRLPLGRLLPGVKVRVLGPPTLAQKADIANQRPTNRDEYWHFHSFWKLRSETSAIRTQSALFGKAEICPLGDAPPEARWFIRRLRQARGEQLLRIVRAMDDALNNTSVVLLMQAGKRKFLFPGDAQWENWEHALARDSKDLKNVDLYKVGHHGSLNATPRSLWKLFAKRGGVTNRARLTTLMSTRSNSKHGHPENRTEVPRETLVTELRANSEFRSTQELENTGGLVLTLEFDL